MARINEMLRLVECVGSFTGVIAQVVIWLIRRKLDAPWAHSDNLDWYAILASFVASVIALLAKFGQGALFTGIGILIVLLVFYAFLLVAEQYMSGYTARMLDFANAYCVLTLSIVGVDGLYGLWYLVLWIFINYAVALALDAWDRKRACYIKY